MLASASSTLNLVCALFFEAPDPFIGMSALFHFLQHHVPREHGKVSWTPTGQVRVDFALEGDCELTLDVIRDSIMGILDPVFAKMWIGGEWHRCVDWSAARRSGSPKRIAGALIPIPAIWDSDSSEASSELRAASDVILPHDENASQLPILPGQLTLSEVSASIGLPSDTILELGEYDILPISKSYRGEPVWCCEAVARFVFEIGADFDPWRTIHDKFRDR